MEDFTPITGAIGGALIGLSAALLLALNGRIAGIAGIIGGAIPAKSGDAAWRLLFALGLVAGAFAYGTAGADLSAYRIDLSAPWIAAAGLLVGFGTRLGAGCTSGHGICGLARLSPRSIVAVAIFMTTAAVTVFVIRHIIGDV